MEGRKCVNSCNVILSAPAFQIVIRVVGAVLASQSFTARRVNQGCYGGTDSVLPGVAMGTTRTRQSASVSYFSVYYYTNMDFG